MKKLLHFFIITALVLLYMLVFRRKMNTWGAGSVEADEELPGDWIIGDKFRATRVIEVMRGTDQVWPWMAQMGRGAGYYSMDYLFNGNRFSADYLLPDLPNPKIGDSNNTIGRIESVEEDKHIVWIRREISLPFAVMDLRMSYILRKRGLGATRIIIRTTMDWRGTAGWIYALLLEPVAYFFNVSQLKALKRLAEEYEARSDSGQCNRNHAGNHQGDLFKLTTV